MRSVFLALAMATMCTANTVTITPAVTYQTWKYWMCAGPDFPGTISNDPAWSSVKASALNQMVNELGCNTLQMNVQSGDTETTQNYFTQWINGTLTNAAFNAIKYAPVNDNGDPASFACDPGAGACPTSFPMDQLDYQVDNFWDGPGGMRAMIQANGETPYIVLTFNHWPLSSSFLDANPAEMGEFMLAAFRHMNLKYGYVPDVIDIQVEPDLHCNQSVQSSFCGGSGGVWDSTKLGNSLAAVKSRLAAGGFFPLLQCCSTSGAQTALGWYTQSKAVAGPGVIGILSSHPYGAFSYNTTSNTNLSAIAAQAAADNIPTVMSEYDVAGVADAMEFMELMNASGFLKYGAIGIGDSHGTAANYITVTNTNPYTSSYVDGSEGSPPDDEPAWFLPQLMHYVRDGAVREKAVADNANYDSVAFRRKGLDVVVTRLINLTGTQTLKVTGTAAGTYGCTYTYNNANFMKSCGANQTIGANGTLSVTLSSIPAAFRGSTTAVVTFYAISVSAAPTINQGGVVPLFGSAPVIQPGSWVSIYGSNLASGTGVWNSDFPTSLGGVTVTINSNPAYLWFVSPSQINLQAPDDTTNGMVNVSVTNSLGTANSTVTLVPVAPSFSLFDAMYAAGVIPTPDGSGAYANGTYDQVGPAGRFAFATRPVKVGETLELFGVGFGPTNPPVPAGQLFNGVAPTANAVAVTIGGVPANVPFSGITAAGLYQLNVVVPAVGSGDQLLQATVAGMQTPSNVYITVN